MDKKVVVLIILLLLVAGIIAVSVYSGGAFVSNSFETPQTVSTIKTVVMSTTNSFNNTVRYTFKDGFVGGYYYKEGTPGYCTVDGITYFYMKYDIPSNMKSLKLCGKSYDTYQNVWRVSYDSENWKLYSDWKQGIAYGEKYQIEIDPYLSSTLYVSYCVVPKCSDPSSVLADLKANVFGNSNYYDVYLDSQGIAIYGDPGLSGAK